MKTSTPSGKTARLHVFQANNREKSDTHFLADLATLFCDGLRLIFRLEKAALDMAVEFNAEAPELSKRLFTATTLRIPVEGERRSGAKPNAIPV
jgi:hypothetical protein